MNTIEDLKSKGKALLIGEAVGQLRLRMPQLVWNAADYDTTVWFSSREVQVRMRRLIRYMVKDQFYTYDIEVDLIGKSILPFDSPFGSRFFIATAAQQKTIDLVKQVTGIGRGAYTDAVYTTTIHEDEQMLHVSIASEAAYRKLFLDKTTGQELVAALEGSYIPMPAIADFKEHSEWQQLLE